MSELVFDPPPRRLPSPAGQPGDRIPHFRYPFRVTLQGAATVDQDSIDDVTQCVYAVLATEIGSRQEEPEFGVIDQTFLQNGADTDELEEVVSEWEPRASLLSEEAWEGLVERVSTEVSLSE